MKYLLIVIVIIIFIFKGCQSCSNDKSDVYDSEYWSSVAREKKMRESGLGNFADMERKNRIEGLRYKKQVKKLKEKTEYNKSNIKDESFAKKKNNFASYSIKAENHIYILDTINGNKILNEEATKYFGKPSYYRLSSLDEVNILKGTNGWVKVQHVKFKNNTGWIESKYLGGMIETERNKEEYNLRNYKNSIQQKKDLDAIDEYMKKHPDF